jgi:UDP-N-acetyl-D-glucosamine dehydrogenase
MPEYVVRKTMDALNERGFSLRGAKILVVGLAYKKNVSDTRESPAVEVMALLRGKGAEVSYSDPHVPVFPAMRRYRMDLESVELTAENLAGADCVVIITDHHDFDYDFIMEHARLIVDSRGVYPGMNDKVVKA